MIVVIFAFQCLQRYCEHCFSRFIVTARRGNDTFAILSSPCGAETISLPFYRRRAARKQYFCRFIVTARRGNNIFAILSSSCSAGTIFLPFYRRRAARKQYFRHFIVVVQRGNDIFAILSSPCGAETIFSHFIVCSITASIKIFVFTFAERRCVLENGRGCAYVPARTSAQRRFHPKMRCCHPQMLHFHLRKACFHVQTRCFYPRKAPPNDGCALAGRAGGHTGTAPTTLIEPPANAETILVIKQRGAHAQTLSVQM